MFVPVKDRLGRPAQQFAGFLAEDAAPLERRLVTSLLQASALALAQSMEAATARSTLNTVLSSLTDAFMSVDHAWCFTRVNRMAAQACGMAPEHMIGRSFWELFPEAIGSPLQAAAHRAESEQVPVQAEAFHPRFGRWSEYHVYPSPDGLGIIETDITSRKQQEARQRLMADLNEAIRLLADLNEAIRLLADPTEMMEVALVLTGRHFGASRMVFAEIEPTTLCVGAYRQYVDGAPDFPGDIELADFGQAALEHLRRGHTLVVEDVMTDERTAEGMRLSSGSKRAPCWRCRSPDPTVCWRSAPFMTARPALVERRDPHGRAGRRTGWRSGRAFPRGARGPQRRAAAAACYPGSGAGRVRV